MDGACQRRGCGNVLRRRRRDRALPDRGGTLPQQSRLGSALSVGRAAADRGRAALCPVCGDGRSDRGRILHAGRRRSRGRCANAGCDTADRRSLCCGAPCRAGDLQTRARPCRTANGGARQSHSKGPGRMNNPENFLTRWSRRKFAAAAESEETKSSAASSRAAPQAAVGSERTAGAERSDGGSHIPPGIASDTAEPPFDPLSVPPIESITADTDIRGFPGPGVPPELTPAPLRRSWAAAPKIRDFVGLADYDWDFNAPGSMAGFGPLEMTDDLSRAAVQIIGRIS